MAAAATGRVHSANSRLPTWSTEGIAGIARLHEQFGENDGPEQMEELTRPITLSLRLFGNMLAGTVMLGVIALLLRP